jgi:nitrogenase cofactor biosynthesis protein NifB
MENVKNKVRVKEKNSQASIEKTKTHPCYNAEAHDYARIHLAVAPKCNISCNYCNRKYDCNNESRPGVTSEVLNPKEALLKYKEAKKKFPTLSVVGIAGPGDALANWTDTKETLKLIREYDADVTFCLSTNGLKLSQYADELISLGVTHITVTINTVYPDVAAKIYRHIRLKGEKHFGIDAAKILLDRQWKAVEYLKDKDVFTKVNIVYLKGINDDHIEEVVKKAEACGASVSNIMAHIPVANTPFEILERAPQSEITDMRKQCMDILPQMLHCNQCRADAVGKLGGCRSAV